MSYMNCMPCGEFYLLTDDCCMVNYKHTTCIVTREYNVEAAGWTQWFVRMASQCRRCGREWYHRRYAAEKPTRATLSMDAHANMECLRCDPDNLLGCLMPWAREAGGRNELATCHCE